MKGLTFDIKQTSGKWLINGKQYADCNLYEKRFFDDFLKHMHYGDSDTH